MGQALAEANAQLDSMSKKKSQGTSKIKAQWVALLDLKDAFKAEETAQKEQEQCDINKEAQKQVDDCAHQSQIIKDTVLKFFDRPLSTYKRKDKFIVLAGALELDTTGTVLALKDHIKTHLKSHKDGLMQNPRFMGMFQARQQHMLDQGTGDGEHSGHGGAGPSGLMRLL